MPAPTDEETAHAREMLIDAADLLRQSLYRINQYGDFLDGIKLTHQRDGSTYGEVNHGLRILLEVLFPGFDGNDILHKACDYDVEASFTTIVQDIADDNAPLSAYSTDDVRDDLVKYRAWKRSVQDGVLPPERIVSGEGLSAEETGFKAVAWLTEQIDECLAALAYRNEPETA
jgi:hypothetical protein